MQRIAPTIDLRLMRGVLHDPPFYSLHDLRTWVLVSDVLDAEEIMNLEAAQAEKTARLAEAKARR